MNANDAYNSLILMVRGHPRWREIDLISLIGVPNTKEGVEIAFDLLASLEINIVVLEEVGDAILENEKTDNEWNNLVVAHAQLEYIANGMKLYMAVKRTVSELIAGYYKDLSDRG